MILLTTGTIGCATHGRRTLSDHPDRRVTVNGQIVQSEASNLLQLLLWDPTVRRMFANTLDGTRDVLVILDGVAMTGPSRLADVRLIEVERVELLRGPQAMLRYGQRAANGAIVVETRFGRTPDPSPLGGAAAANGRT
jgi:hypothetical protein